MMLFGLLIFACSEKETTTSGLVVSTESLDFGEQPIYTQETQTFTITSQEPSDVSILSLTLTGVGTDDWEVERGDDTELSMGELLEIDVTFKPQELNTTTPELQIRTTLESQDKIYIALSGTGTESIDDSDEDGYSPADGDCDDNDASRYPNAEEICDGKDNNCDEIIPEDEVDADVDGYRLCADDCDDNDYQVYPGAEEICDQKDSDCDGFMPDNEDFDGDGYPLCDGDCEDEDPTIWPDNPEICDGIDNNCSGGVDDIDEDGDGYSPCLINGDCDDNDPTAYPIVLDLSADPDGDGSLDAPYDTLEMALNNLDPVCRTIVMMPGTYNINLEWNDGFVAFNGGGAGPEEVILESGGRIADLSSGGSIRFSNLTIQNGQGSGDGGAVRVQGGSLTLEQVHLYNNHAVGDGGAVSISDGSLTLHNAIFDSNSSEDDGGAISMLSGILIDHGSHYLSNTGTRGGAILLDVSDAQITGAQFTSNVASSTGGAIALSAGTLLQAQQSVFSSNTSTEKGGAIFIGNHAQQDSYIRNNIFQGNITSQKGGALAFSGAISSMMVANNTFVDNQSAQQGAAIFGEATDSTGLYIWSNIFFANDGNYALYLMDESIASIGYNSAFLTTSVVPWYFDVNGDAGENREEDPNFINFSNDGDPTNDDFSLSIGSPMINAGPSNGDPLFYSTWEDLDGTANDRGHLGGQGAAQ
ncbi:MAG: hypothetical protein CL916_14980 [Deltaproteobacteria bacterium]|nr:hypothetical protein [Deltaproteobacteria bacterium]